MSDCKQGARSGAQCRLADSTRHDDQPFGRNFGHSGKEQKGVLRALLEKSDLILMHLGLPDVVASEEATAQNKANAATTHMPMVVQAAFLGPDRSERALAAEAAEVVYNQCVSMNCSRNC
jgi:DNA-binding NarL/FixJ family response regulator